MTDEQKMQFLKELGQSGANIHQINFGDGTQNFYAGNVQKADTTEVRFEEIKTDGTNDYGFDTELLSSYVIVEEKDKVAEILVDMIGPYKGKGKPKEALLPFYCAIDSSWIRRPEYEEFNRIFPEVLKSKASYSDYIPYDKSQSKYCTNGSTDIDAMCETMLSRLKR